MSTTQGGQPLVPPAPPPPAPVYTQPSRAHAIAAMVLGIVGLVLFFVPFVGPILCVLALIFGIIALVRRYHGRGFAVAGVATGAVGLLVGALWTWAVVDTAEDISNERDVAADTTTTPSDPAQARLCERWSQVSPVLASPAGGDLEGVVELLDGMLGMATGTETQSLVAQLRNELRQGLLDLPGHDDPSPAVVTDLAVRIDDSCGL